MPETQGRGSYDDEGRIERAAKYAHENGGNDASIDAAARREFSSSVTTDIKNRIRQKMYQLFRK